MISSCRAGSREARWHGHPEKLRSELEQRLEEQKALQWQRPIEDILNRCRAWLASVPPETVLEQSVPDVEDGLSLSDVRARIKKLQAQVEALKRVPVPASDIERKVRNYVEGLPMPSITGIAAGQALTVQWPTGLHALLAFVKPEVLAERTMAEIDRIANTPYPLAQRQQRIAKFEEEIDHLPRCAEAIIVAIGAPRQPGSPPWVVLGVKVRPCLFAPVSSNVVDIFDYGNKCRIIAYRDQTIGQILSRIMLRLTFSPVTVLRWFLLYAL